MTVPVPFQPQDVQYPSSAPQPQFWPEFVAIAVDVATLIAIGSWAFSLMRKAWKGEEVKL
jgi:hypothetical protein